MPSPSSLTAPLARALRQLHTSLGNRFESDATGTVYARAAEALNISQPAAIQRIHRLAALGFLKLTYEGIELEAVTFADETLIIVQEFERRRAQQPEKPTSLQEAMRKAVKAGRPSAVTRPVPRYTGGIRDDLYA